MKVMLVAALGVLLGACASGTPNQSPSAATETTTRKCETDVPTGSRLPTRRCRDVDEIAQNEQDARDMTRASERARPARGATP